IESQILTHYPRTLEVGLAITEQEAVLHPQQANTVVVSDLIRRLIEQVAFEARTSELVDKKSGVSARLTISALENAVSTAELRSISNGGTPTQVWISDLVGIIPSITGKIELVYEGEQEGPYQVAHNLVNKAIRTQFLQFFPNPEQAKKRRQESKTEQPYRSITAWFDAGNSLHLQVNMPDEQKMRELYRVDGLHALVKKHFRGANEQQAALLMEFVLHGLAAYSLISKKLVEGRVEFSDLMGSMLNLGGDAAPEEDYDGEDFT
ncbi:MAG TPA: magnesium chelatase, partial [Lacibacter sp.]|nr:magnesium chelatase [Lacibacter sp.]